MPKTCICGTTIETDGSGNAQKIFSADGKRNHLAEFMHDMHIPSPKCIIYRLLGHRCVRSDCAADRDYGLRL